MKKWMLAICLMFINEICQATDCFDLAGRDYKIDPDLLRAISWQESRYRVNAIGINPVTGYGSGLMQVDSQHFNELARYGIKPEHLTTDPCMNIYTGIKSSKGIRVPTTKKSLSQMNSVQNN